MPADQRALITDILGGAHTQAQSSQLRLLTLDAQIATARAHRDGKNSETDRYLMRLTGELRPRLGSAGLTLLQSVFGGKLPLDVSRQPHNKQR